MTHHARSTARTDAAFTLIEMSIVLVIVALLAAGVLVGRDLIRGFERRTLVSELGELQTTFNTFRLKYNCVPGDCSQATSFFGAATTCGNDPTNNALPVIDGTCNGNGNGKVDGGYSTYPEEVMSQQQLTLAGPIPVRMTHPGQRISGVVVIGLNVYVPGQNVWASRFTRIGSITNVENVPVNRLGMGIADSSVLQAAPSFASGGGYALPPLSPGAHLTVGTSGLNITLGTASRTGMYPDDVYFLDGKLDDGMP